MKSITIQGKKFTVGQMFKDSCDDDVEIIDVEESTKFGQQVVIKSGDRGFRIMGESDNDIEDLAFLRRVK